MNAYRLTVNSCHYVVETEDDLTEWKASVAEAVQSGGGFVNVTNAGGFPTALLITPNSTVTLQKVRHLPRPEPWTQLLAEEAFTYEDFYD